MIQFSVSGNLAQSNKLYVCVSNRKIFKFESYIYRRSLGEGSWGGLETPKICILIEV